MGCREVFSAYQTPPTLSVPQNITMLQSTTKLFLIAPAFLTLIMRLRHLLINLTIESHLPFLIPSSSELLSPIFMQITCSNLYREATHVLDVRTILTYKHGL